MANVGPNRGRRLRLALSRFAAMLIEEAQSISGLSYAQLDEALDLPSGQSFRYSRYPVEAKTRAPQAGSVQRLENRVAVFLKRPRHIVVVERSEEHTSELQSLMRISYAVFCLKKKNNEIINTPELSPRQHNK